MKITCPVCDAKYSITDEKVQDRLAKIRCRKCGTTIVIDGKVDPPNVYAADTPAAAQASGDADESSSGAGGEYTVDFGENDQRSMSLGELVQAFKSGQVTRDTYVWAEGFADWKAFGEVSELTTAIQGGAEKPAPPAAPSPAAPAALAAKAALPWDKKPAATLDIDEEEQTRIATRGAATLGGAGDLFGGFATAGSEEEVTTSAAHQEPPAPAAAPVTASTGARNESSVLFSLSALTAAAASKPSRPPVTPSSPSEDSGLIDLKALASAAQKSPANAPAMGMAVPLGLSPLGGSSPLGTPSMAVPSPLAGGGFQGADFGGAPPKSKTGLYLVAALFFGLLAIAAVLALRPSPTAETPAPTPTQAAVAETAPPPKEKEPEPAAEEAAQPPATGTAEAGEPPAESSKTAPAKVGSAKATRRTTKPAGASKPASEPAASPAAPAAPKKKSGGCGCAPGDLMCAMQCASK